MTDKRKCDEFAADMARRFDEFVQWSIENWPVPESPLMESDFDASRAELHRLLGQRLDEARNVETAPDPAAGGPQYVSLNPAPWP